MQKTIETSIAERKAEITALKREKNTAENKAMIDRLYTAIRIMKRWK